MELRTSLVIAGCAAALTVLGFIRGRKKNAWRALEQRHPSPQPLQGPEYRLRWCWFGTRAQPYENCFRAQLAAEGIRVRGMGPYAWFREPVLLPWSATRSLTDAGPLSFGIHQLLLDIDGIEAGLAFPRDALPALARYGVVPSAV